MGDLPQENEASAAQRDDPFRRYELFYQYARSTYELAHASWSAADEKASRVGAVLALLLGVSVFGLDPIVRALERRECIDLVFFGSSVGFGAVTVAAFWQLLKTVALRDIQMPPATREMVDHFADHDYIDVLYSVGREYLDAAATATESANEKFHAVGKAIRLIQIGLVTLILTLVLYVYIRLEMPSA